MKKLMLVMMAVISVVSFSACNTVQGIGKDIEKGGEAIQKATR